MAYHIQRTFDPKWGRFLSSQRFNLDDWSIPFVIDSKKTYVIIEPGDRYQKTWISQPSSGWMMNFGGRDGSQPNIAITFWGTGKGIRPDKKAAYHPDVNVYWQINAWADTKCSVNWVNPHLKSQWKILKDFVDNLTAQQTDELKKTASDLKGVVWYGFKNPTNLRQVVNTGIARALKVLTGHHYHQWMDERDNLGMRNDWLLCKGGS